MRAMDVQFLSVTYNRPIDGYLLWRDAKLDERAELPDHVQSLFNSARMARCFDVDVAPIASCHSLTFSIAFSFLGLMPISAPQPLATSSRSSLRSKCDDSPRSLHLSGSHHSQPERPTACDHDRVLVSNVAPFHRMNRTRQRFDKDSMMPRSISPGIRSALKATPIRSSTPKTSSSSAKRPRGSLISKCR